MPKTYRIKGFQRKGGVKVKAQTRKAPKLSSAERKRRGRLALTKLVPAAEKWVGKVGFDECVKRLTGKPGITNPVKLCGFLKGEAKEKRVLAKVHKYVGRKGFRKYKIGGKKVLAKEYYKKKGKQKVGKGKGLKEWKA